MNREYNVAIVGATGAVGNEMVRILESRQFPVKSLKLLASAKSAGKKMKFKGKEIRVEELIEKSFDSVEIALFSAGKTVSKKFAPLAVKAGAVVVDNTSAFRMDPDVPLVVPEVNLGDLAWHHGIIANPNCSTIGMVVALKPLHDYGKIQRVVVTTFQSVSGAGAKAVHEMYEEARAILDKKPYQRKIFPHQIAFNVLPQIPQVNAFQSDGYTDEEVKMIQETKKIMGDPSIRVTATTVRVAVERCHSESINIETQKKINAFKARELLSKAPGIKVVDDPANQKYPLAAEVAGKDDTYVGRIREDNTVDNGLNLWVVSDNLRKGAALNAIQIAEILIKEPQQYLPRKVAKVS